MRKPGLLFSAGVTAFWASHVAAAAHLNNAGGAWPPKRGQFARDCRDDSNKKNIEVTFF